MSSEDQRTEFASPLSREGEGLKRRGWRWKSNKCKIIGWNEREKKMLAAYVAYKNTERMFGLKCELAK